MKNDPKCAIERYQDRAITDDNRKLKKRGHWDLSGTVRLKDRDMAARQDTIYS